jgi:hypothetical protein
MKRIAYLIGTLLLMSCVTGPYPYLDASHKPPHDQQRDEVECQALAGQAAFGSGDWSSDRAIRAAIAANVRDHQYVKCLKSRGWTWKSRY